MFLKKIVYKLLPSFKVGNDIDIEYNKCGGLKPLNISNLSLILPMKKKILKLREQNRVIKIVRENKKLSVIVPYRNRKEHLERFLPAIEKELQKQKIDYEIVIVEQDNKTPFNRAKLLNIGVLEARKESDYFVFHDVDALPVNVDYRFCNHTVKLFNYLKEENEQEYKEYGETIFGGITLVPKNIFFEINGFSNNYWQWGKEDDDFLLRHLLKAKVPFIDMEGKFILMPHEKTLNLDNEGKIVEDKTFLLKNKSYLKENKRRFSLFKRRLSSQEEDGVNSVKKYQVLTKKNSENINFLSVELR